MKQSYNTLLCTMLCGLIFVCCSPRKKEATVTPTSDSATTIVTVDVQNYPAIPYDSVIDHISFVKLESNDDCLIAEISQLLCTDSLIFVVDRKAKNVLSFDKRGKFLRKISRVGQGPGEYYGSILCNLCLNPMGEELILSDFGKICHYTLDGRFLKEEKVSWNYEDIEMLDDGMLCTFWMSGNPIQDDKPMLNIYKNVDEWHYGAFPSYTQKGQVQLSPGSTLHRFDDCVYFCNPFSSTFYEVTPNDLKERFRVVFKGQEEIQPTENIDYKQFRSMLQNRIYSEKLFVLKDKVVFDLRKSESFGAPFVIHSLNTGKTYCCDLEKTQNPMFVYHHVPDARDGDHNLVVARQVVEVMNKKQWIYNHPNADKQVLDQLYDGLTEESNPVLFFFHVKEDL